MKIDELVTFIKRPEDRPYLVTPLLDVSMRLYRDGSTSYAKVVKQACMHIGYAANTQYEDYPPPYGMSGANVGIPWNIIAIVTDRGLNRASAKIMINPRIIKSTCSYTMAKSNCGSLRLPKPIKVMRRDGVLVGWYNLKGEYKEEWFEKHNQGFTIQHEIDHNKGILIDPKAANLI